jgi:putative oxidoreductase
MPPFSDRRAVVTKYLQAQSLMGGRMDLGRTALRLVIGPLFVGHGTQKLFGWFGGHGREGTGAFFEQIGLKPGKRHATGAGAAEAVGGALLTLGALTPVAAGLITGTMVTAIRKVHAPKGPWNTDGGYEYNLTLIAAMAALAEVGPGRPSVDASVLPRLKGNGLALAQFAGATAAAALLTSERTNAEPGADTADDTQAERQNRFAREEAEVPAGS